VTAQMGHGRFVMELAVPCSILFGLSSGHSRLLLVQDDAAGVVEVAQVRCPGMQIDAAVKSVGLGGR